MVRLKVIGERKGARPYWCFNSIVVRLKVIVASPVIECMGKFQFHSGSIKSGDLRQIDDFAVCFNSIVVRLKDNQCVLICRGFESFNSIVVRLKGKRVVLCFLLLSSFNSIVVRLKVRFQRSR